ncbi:MAG: glycosyltransferase [Oscillospiraceae bacterium]|nr:glycosyltransferase [Oscillospiraceae bacterium]
MIKFSLTMCVYIAEDPQNLSQCFDSILSQTVLPDELVIVKDGPLTIELDNVINNIKFPGGIKIIALPKNVTQGPARAAGVKAANHDWVAIMDSDDVCLSDRFEKQLKMIENNPELGLIGGQIAEFWENSEKTTKERTVPIKQECILEFAKKRNPFNQMTVMFKRDMAINAGNYRYFPWFEDYDLWARLIKDGAICANHPDILVNVRVGTGMYTRRRGKSYICSEWRMQKQLRSLGMINRLEFARNVALRIPVRLLPAKMIKAVYNRFARESR